MSAAPQGPKKRLQVESVGDVTEVSFLDRRILDEQNIQILADQLFALVDDERRHKLILNFGNVEYLSSAALGKLITLHKKLEGLRGRLVLCRINQQIKEVFVITRLDKVFTIKEDEDSAYKAM